MSQLSIQHRAYFRTEIFNRLIVEYENTILGSLIQHNLLKTAKGCRRFSELTDMPYHIHILNGLYPGLLLLEQHLQNKYKGMIESNIIEQLLKSLIVGFTFHDLNKLVNIEPLEKALAELPCHAKKLNVESFFPEWQDYLPEIEFFILGTENRTATQAFSRPIREWNFLNDVLRPICHFADSIASVDNFDSVAEFYDRICNIRLNYLQHLGEIQSLSYVEINDNICVLLSQKVLNLAKSIIQGDRVEQILFNLRNGFVYIGAPLNEDEINRIKVKFNSEETELNPVNMTTIDHQSCKFGFIESTLLSETILHNIVKEKINDLLKVGTDVSNDRCQTILSSLLDTYELPIRLEKKTVKLFLEKEWAEIEEYHALLKLFGLQKIKFLSGKIKPEWRKEFEKFRGEEIPFLNEQFSYPYNGQIVTITQTKELLSIFEKENTKYTIAALISVCEAQNNEQEMEEILAKTFDDVINTFNKSTKPQINEPFDEFVDVYLSGNFQQDISKFMKNEQNIPQKAEMCIFCGKPSAEDYGSEKSFGINALGFNNRTVNTLKSKINRICLLCARELRMRKSRFNQNRDSNSAIYYDFGEYLFNADVQSLLAILDSVFKINIEEKRQDITITIDNRAFNYNFYNLNFEKINDTLKENFWFIKKTLTLIKYTGFRIFTTSVISPYNQHKEMFVFENCMPFVKQLGWDKIRIDEIDERLQELNLLYSLGQKQIVSTILSYATDRRSIFSAFYRLGDEEKKSLQNEFIKFVQLHKEVFSMGVMDKLTDYAIRIELGFGSGGAESGLIRDSLDILKSCYKEKRDRDITIQQVAGGIYKKFKSEKDILPDTLLGFAKTLYDDLFIGEWQGHIPQPIRLKNWINQFAFLYRMKSLEEIRKNHIRNVIKVLENEGKEANEQNVFEQLLKNKPETKRYEDEYLQCFRDYFKQ